MVMASTKTELDSIAILRYLGMQNVDVTRMLKRSGSIPVNLSNFLHKVQESNDLFFSLFVLYSLESF